MFSDFHGNGETVTRVREMLARDRFPHAVIIAGPAGSGKYTLAQMIAKAMNCQERPEIDGLPDFCGKCSNCVRIGEADALEQRCDEAVEARENLRETDKRETRILIQTHPDVLIIPPDPPQMMIKVDQVRRVRADLYARPIEGRRRVYIFTTTALMKEAANGLLKALEEPPEFSTMFLLAENASVLLPTIRSRCITLQLAPLGSAEVEQYLAKRKPEWSAQQRRLVARLSKGALGRAFTFDLAAYSGSRNDALIALRTAVDGNEHTELFRATETYRAGAEGKEKTERFIGAMYSLLEDMLFIKGGTPELIRNIDIEKEVQRLAASCDFRWIAGASDRLAEVESGMRRNLLRSLSLDAFATSLEQV
jgi:DNA polymerase III subunit delta'